jgi:hypothetical protein
MRLLAIDPATKSVAFALFDKGLLSACGMRSADSLELLLAELRVWNVVEGGEIDETVIEVPVVYPTPRSKADPEDIVRLAVAAGGAATAAGGVVTIVRPRQWKGTVPKAVHNRRVLRTLKADDPLGYKIFEASTRRMGKAKHNVIDAIGIGLWRLRR